MSYSAKTRISSEGPLYDRESNNSKNKRINVENAWLIARYAPIVSDEVAELFKNCEKTNGKKQLAQTMFKTVVRAIVELSVQTNRTKEEDIKCLRNELSAAYGLNACWIM